MHPIKNISYIITFRKTNQYTEESLNQIIHTLNLYFPTIEIILIEQDAEPQPNSLKGNFKLAFLYNTKHVNSGWAFNYGSSISENDSLVFSIFNACLSVDDYHTFFSALNKKNTDAVILPEMHGIKRNVLLSIGGWPEEYLGHEACSKAMTLHLNALANPLELNLQASKIPSSIDTGTSVISHDIDDRSLSDLAKAIEENKTQYSVIRQKVTNVLGIGNRNKYENAVHWSKEIIDLLSNHRRSKIQQPARKVLAVTTYNRITYLHAFLKSFLTTIDNPKEWYIIIADDGSIDETSAYLKLLQENWDNFKCIQNNRRGVSHQFNSIALQLSEMDFDICFTCNDDVIFISEGWDKLYIDTIKETGFQHLCHYYKGWLSFLNIEPKTKHGRLVAYCEPENVQGAFFTITPDIINKVGYMDAANFSPRGWGHTDYTIRCGRAGFNDNTYIYDVLGSNDYIILNYNQTYVSTVEHPELFSKICPPEETARRKKLITDNTRIFLPYNESPKSYNDRYLLDLSYSIINELKQELAESSYLLKEKESLLISQTQNYQKDAQKANEQIGQKSQEIATLLQQNIQESQKLKTLILEKEAAINELMLRSHEREQQNAHKIDNLIKSIEYYQHTISKYEKEFIHKSTWALIKDRIKKTNQ